MSPMIGVVLGLTGLTCYAYVFETPDASFGILLLLLVLLLVLLVLILFTRLSFTPPLLPLLFVSLLLPPSRSWLTVATAFPLPPPLSRACALPRPHRPNAHLLLPVSSRSVSAALTSSQMRRSRSRNRPEAVARGCHSIPSGSAGD
eukprot:752608-Hanusia_phi.AAC.1